jgi:hypothetical protein
MVSIILVHIPFAALGIAVECYPSRLSLVISKSAFRRIFSSTSCLIHQRFKKKGKAGWESLAGITKSPH